MKLAVPTAETLTEIETVLVLRENTSENGHFHEGCGQSAVAPYDIGIILHDAAHMSIRLWIFLHPKADGKLQSKSTPNAKA